MSPDNERREDERFTALFALLREDATRSDPELRDQLLARSAEVFAAEASEPSRIDKHSARRKRMFFMAIRGLAATATAIAIGLGLWTAMAPQETAPAFGEVLDDIASASSLHVEVKWNGVSGTAWIRSGRMRVNLADGTYRIARGEREWHVDEAANRASSRSVAYFREDGGVDPLRLLEVAHADTDEVAEALKNAAIERGERDGEAVDVYTASVAGEKAGEATRIECVVDARTRVVRVLRSFAVQGERIAPIAQVNILSVDEAVDEELFVVGETLTEDGRIGKVTDVQGIVSVKPVMRRRFTPVTGPVILKPGDWLRTDVRGANAVAVRLVKETDVTLGPGTLVELSTPRRVKLVSGEVKIVATKKQPVELVGPDGEKTSVRGTVHFRVDRRTNQLVKVEKPPVWLGYFEGTTTQDSIGSLVANVDGRDVPLTVGYHKVTVDVRDQIARTVIEESFVNRTRSRLEGVFYFPLPQDASISGFGMWIGNELVEADVVEKQRAREIYETILRENRDPGLLEWTGGNLFKARVFPIEALSEKRIKITYTQVLPLRNGRYRYSYALKSEMLKLHPLRELAVDVKLSSTMPLADVTCPTHPARIDKTAHTAHVEFTAQEYAPDRDFEVVVETDDKQQQDVVVIPHRRGEDGYFMMLLTPPSPAGKWQRETLPDGEPLELLILADTSGSMDTAARKNQAELVASLLSSLTDTDRINLATCDVECDWVFDESQPVTDENVATIHERLERRVSLGWTNLDVAFESAAVRCTPDTQLIYIGDGVVNTTNADPVAFANRLKRMFAEEVPVREKGSGYFSGSEQKSSLTPFCFHAISVGSSFESIVLNAIASLGGGSARQVSGERTPQKVAAELLAEMTRPSIRDLAVSFSGLRTARVYPETLPNLASGKQQILLGRYLPEGVDQHGQVTVTGVLGDEPVRFSTKVSLADAEHGNSFIPRLWARMHLDTLLGQGSSPSIKDEIIGLSEEYHIITPYTSLLVLESDADRERFKVKRRFEMRDGQRFFAEGRDQADFELMQKQMRLAGNWRLGLRRQVLRGLIGLGRDASVFQQVLGDDGSYYWGDVDEVRFAGFAGSSIRGGRDSIDYFKHNVSNMLSDKRSFAFRERELMEELREEVDRLIATPSKSREADNEDSEWGEWDDAKGRQESRERDFIAGDPLPIAAPLPTTAAPLPTNPMPSIIGSSTDAPRSESEGKKIVQYGVFGPGDGYMQFGKWKRNDIRAGDNPPVYDTTWLTGLFPALGGPSQPPQPPNVRWPMDARRLAESLLRTESLAAMTGGLQIERTDELFDPRWDTLTTRSESRVLVSPDAWLARSGGGASRTLVSWCDESERGVFSVDLELGRVRKATSADQEQPPLSLSGHVLRSMEVSYPAYRVELKPKADDRTLVVLQHPTASANQMHILIDTHRHVVLRIENRYEGTVTTLRFGDFVQVAGAWWATRVEKFNDSGERTSTTTLVFTELDPLKFADRMKRELAPRDHVQLLHEPLPTVADAKQALADERVDFEDRIVLAVHFSRIQNWERVAEHLDAAAILAKDKPGMKWVHRALLQQSRRREELRTAIMAEKDKPMSYSLTRYLVGRASSAFSAGEMLELLDTLLPVYQRQPKHLLAMKSWHQRRRSYLDQTGQRDAALELRRELAESYPHDYSLQQQYVDALVNTGDREAAYAWLDAAIVPERRWSAYEADRLRGSFTSLLEREGRYVYLVERLAGQVATRPAGETPYYHYLSALVKAGEEEQANERIARWLAVEVRDDATPLEPSDAARLSAAIGQALGQGYNLRTNRLEERWIEPLAKLVEPLATHKTLASQADHIMGNGLFQQQDACRRLRRKITARLTDEIDTLPVHRIRPLVNWIWPNDPAVEAGQWRKIAIGLERRWEHEEDAIVKHELAAPLIHILSGKLTADEHLAFLRRQLEEGPEPYRAGYIHQLFNAVIAQPWTAELEDEACTLLPTLAETEQPSERLRAQVATLYRFTDRMVQARYDALMLEVEHQEEMTKTEQREKQSENMRAAREGFADRLRREMPTAADDMRPWLGVERLYLLVRLNKDFDRVAEECWEVLGPAPVKPVKPDQPVDQTDAVDAVEPFDVTAALLDGILHERHLAILTNLAARGDAEPQLVKRLLAYLDAGIDAAGDNKASANAWRSMKYRMLIALDRPADLEAAMREWIQPSDADNYWRRALGYLMAEQGRVTEAIALLEAVEKTDELSPADYRALAGWYMVADARDKHERALIQAFKASEEWRLSNWLQQKLQPWQRSDSAMPDELDKDVLRVFAALFEKSSSPQNYLHQLRAFYGATRDFRLLTSLADSVVGHTAGRVYPFLQSMGSVLGEIRDEATADSLIEQLEKVRSRANTPIDHRGLDLLELLVERRASEVLNQPGPHVERALAAMQRAFDREWSEGEPRPMADLLASLGHISQEPLATEQVRQLTVLHDREEKGSIDRLHIAHALARTHWSYSRHDQAIDLLESALAEHETAVGGILPQYANGPLSTFIGYLESRGHHARGERFLFAQLEHPIIPQQRYWLVQRLYQLYDSALSHDAEVSLGRGEELYRTVQRNLQEELKTEDHNHRYQLINRLCTIYRTAHNKKLPGVVDDLREFAFKRLPQVLGQQTNNYQSIVGQVAGTLRDLASPRDGLELLIDRIENEPRWFRLNNQDGWRQHAYRLGQWRGQVGAKLGDLEPRLLAIVIAELKRDLHSRQSRNRTMYHRHHGNYFWSEKAEDLHQAAEEVYAKDRKSGAAVQYIADYLWWGLDRHNRAIEILLLAHRAKILDESGQSKLVDFLHREERYKESIPILLPLVESRPDNIQYRVWLMHAYYQVGRQADLLALLKATDEYFHQGNRWQESIIAALSHSCLQNHLFEQSAAYYEEVINLHQRTQPGRGIGNGTLSGYYGQLSQVYSGLKKTPEAVDAACGAIVSWGPRHDQRTAALNSLEQVLRNAPDLDAYVAHLDKQAKETGLQNPIVRKALGKTYFFKQQYKQAIRQLEIAIDLQPNDTETHQKLVDCYDQLGEKQSAINQLLESVRLSRRNIGLFKELAARYDLMQNTKQAERARTSIVEALPNESEGHAALAEIRQQQDHWGESIAHWQQVAEIRALEPTGLIKLATAQIHEKQWDAADDTCRKLRDHGWPSRFGDIEQQTRNLQQQIDTGRH